MAPVRRRTGAALAAALGVLMLVAPSSGAAVRKPTDTEKLRELTKQMQKLDRELGGELEDLKDLQQDAAKSVKQRDDLKDDLLKSHNVVSRLASSQYMRGGTDPTLSVLQYSDPSMILPALGMTQYLSSNEAGRANQIQQLLDLQIKATRAANTKLNALEKTIREIRADKKSIQKKIDKFAPTPMIGNSGLTSRLVTLRAAIMLQFGPFPAGIGCLRSGDPMDHGSGRACDFMESTGGSMPTADRVAHGDALTAWAMKNADKYGVKYVIWRQKYYDARRPGTGGRPMSDRGSTTANHYDHVHISVF